MTPSHDPTVFLCALGALLVLLLAGVALFQWRRTRPNLLEEAARGEAEKTRLADQARARAAESKARAEFELAVKEGKLLPDGRVPCQASSQCGSPALHPSPTIARDNGFGDFIRTRFGAPENYRLVDEKEPFWDHILVLFGGVARHRRPVVYCESHIHVVRQVCQAKLARDEQEQQESRKRREVALATFETRGMLADVQTLVREAELPPAAPVVESKPSRRPSRRPATKPTSFPSVTNGSSNGHNKGALS